MMSRDFGYKSQSYAAELIDEDVIDALPQQQQDRYIENEIAPQIEEKLKNITFDNEEQKLKFILKLYQLKTAKELGRKHANKLQPYDPKYKDNEYYKSNFMTRLQEILNQDTLKIRGENKSITKENKDEAKKLLKH